MTKKFRISTLSVIIIVMFGVFYTSCKKEEAAPLVATSIALESGGDQTAQVETALTGAVVVLVKDQNGKAFKGATVKFETTDGSVSAATGTTDVNGKATVTWTLGATVGGQTLTVTAFKADGTTALTGLPITVNATASAVPLVATSIELVSGNNQSAIVETAITNPVVIMVKDQNGDAFAGTEVSFATTDGTVSAAAVTTDASGNASVTWILGVTVGVQALTATVMGLTGSPVEFSATGEVAPLVATSIEIASGNNQSAIVETAITNPVVIMVKDQNGDAFTGTEVNFTTTDGSVSSATAITDASGNASVTWTLGTTVGAQTLNATVTGLTGSPIEFSATGEEPPVVGDFAYGGVVFYLFVDGDNRYVAGETHGLVCAVSDEDGGTGAEWGCYGTDITGIPNQINNTMAKSEDVDGLAYSNAIVNECVGTTAASICRAKSTGGYDNWYLPTLRELIMIYDNKTTINATATNNGGTALLDAYWSSTENTNNLAWFYAGYTNPVNKDNSYSVRAVRAF